jgi:hypothetical protein
LYIACKYANLIIADLAELIEKAYWKHLHMYIACSDFLGSVERFEGYQTNDKKARTQARTWTKPKG